MDTLQKLFNGYYKNKNVLVTGHTGFKGSWLSVWLHELGANVIGYSLAPYTQRDNFELSLLKNKIVDLRGDIRDFDKLKSVFEKYKPEVVFHLAAQPLVRLSYDLPRETFEQNIMGTVNVLECVRQTSSTKVCINITSDKCYENKEWIWGYRENDPMGGYDPYSASKGCSEIIISAYIRSFFSPATFSTHNKAVASVRAGNVIGGGDWAKDRIIPDCIRAIESNVPIEVRSPKAIRPWQHVLEPLSGYLHLASMLYANPKRYSGAWNFGPNIESLINVEQIVEKFLIGMNKGTWLDTSDKANLHEATLLNLDCSKAFYYLNWKPTFNIDQCIKLVTEWYSEYEKNDVYKICVAQISQYTQVAKCIGNTWSK